MNQSWKFKPPSRRVEIDGIHTTVKPEIGFHYISGNALPHFSVTAETVDKHGRAFGCQHEAIVAAFPEFSILIPWHLADLNGLPMHYIANAKYHYGQWARALGVSVEFKTWPLDSYGRTVDPRASFMNHSLIGRISSIDGIRLCIRGDYDMSWDPAVTVWPDVEKNLDYRKRALYHAMRADVSSFPEIEIPVWNIQGGKS